ncbi:hypothetical protein HWN40_03885 [Methanolobus zinderi]|jgi:chromosome segregation ATPase|uniref:Uncharacterized protein n=1 Tax=Methanolobus zinderi TaxID=536044 RepID=A0A7D5E858_9EURY|nr:hypothetical protein [Methanolobus zinderi]QLC49457.1 hypothetical protein HWN40_03885 [Methanolobus zinderi]
MSDSAQDGTAVDITTYEKQELLEKVIDKHKRFLDEYTSELSGIENRMESLNSVISSSKQKKEEMNSKLDILAEKRQLFYHQAEKELDDLKSLAEGDSAFLKALREVSAEVSKAKTQLPPEEEKKIVNSILENLSSLSPDNSNIRDAVALAKARVNDALASSTELSSIKNSDVDFDKEKADSEKELNEIAPRHKWLENRIGSHREALDYWKKLSSGQVNEVKA